MVSSNNRNHWPTTYDSIRVIDISPVVDVKGSAAATAMVFVAEYIDIETDLSVLPAQPPFQRSMPEQRKPFSNSTIFSSFYASIYPIYFSSLHSSLGLRSIRQQQQPPPSEAHKLILSSNIHSGMSLGGNSLFIFIFARISFFFTFFIWCHCLLSSSRSPPRSLAPTPSFSNSHLPDDAEPDP